MKNRAVFLLSGVLVVLFMGGLPAHALEGTLLPGDCIKCHDKLIEEFSVRGAKHQAQLNCTDCHLEHPPVGRDVIPECSRCHAPADKKHYAVSGCLACHDPHAPLEISFDTERALKPVCISCHSRQGEENQRYPSKHSEQDCTNCHLKHGEFLTCLECHEPHTPEMQYENCLTCHGPHMPTLVRYPDSTPVSFCKGCHPEQAEKLKNMPYKHGKLACAYCHKMQHRLIPECIICHGHRHAKKIHRKFPVCNECHNSAHDLSL